MSMVYLLGAYSINKIKNKNRHSCPVFFYLDTELTYNRLCQHVRTNISDYSKKNV